MSTQTVSVSTKTVFKIIAILALIYLLFLIKGVFAMFFVALVLASAFDPMIDWLQARKFPRSLSILLVYFIALLIAGVAVSILGGQLIRELVTLSKAFPEYTATTIGTWGIWGALEPVMNTEVISSSLSEIASSLKQVTSGIFSFFAYVFGGIFSFLMVLVITFYMTVDEKGMQSFINSVTPKKHQAHVNDLIDKMKHRMGYWLRGQLILSVIIFILTYVGLSLLGIKYALILSLVAAIFEIVPFLGPWISAVPAVFFGFLQSPMHGILVAVLYLVVQQIENNIIVPKVMGKSTGLNPLIVLLSILAGAQLAGIVGALLAVPVATAIAVYIESIIKNKKIRESSKK